MKKIIALIIFIFLLSGCQNKNFNKENINTIIEEDNKNLLISINYPVTNSDKLNQKIDEKVDTIYNSFKKEYSTLKNADSELNIDYTYKIINDNYINITLTIFIDSSTLSHPDTYITTFVFSIKDNNFLTIGDLITDISKLENDVRNSLHSKYQDCLLDSFEINNNLMFTFDDNNLVVYFNPYFITSGYCGIISIELPLYNYQLKREISKDIIETINYESISSKNKVIDPEKPVIALTFDDGPSGYTKDIIDVLKSYNVNATFFVLGNKVSIYDDIIRDVLECGNEIGNHSYNHKQLTKLSPIEIQMQIIKTQDIIKEVSGYTPVLLRPTYGEVNKKVRDNSNLKIVLWDIDSLDWKKKSGEKIAEGVIRKAHDQGIILMHDTKKRTMDAIKIIIPTLLEQGYQFVTISELEEVKLLRKN